MAHRCRRDASRGTQRRWVRPDAGGEQQARAREAPLFPMIAKPLAPFSGVKVFAIMLGPDARPAPVSGVLPSEGRHARDCGAGRAGAAAAAGPAAGLVAGVPAGHRCVPQATAPFSQTSALVRDTPQEQAR
jgi:hypothetical protein